MSDKTITKEKIIEALSSQKLHPSIPDVIVAIIHITQSQDASINDLVRVIEQDEELSARILKIANSGYYGTERIVKTVPNAVVLMGWNNVKMISLGSTIMKVINEKDPRLYTHSIKTAQYATCLATRANFYKVEDISVVGLLHDIGSIILQSHFTDLYLEAKQYAINYRVPMYVAEREVMKTDHAVIGGWTVEEWQLPENIIEAVERHHSFDPNTYHAKKTAVIHVGDCLSIAADYYGPAWEKVPEIEISSFKTLGFDEDKMKKIALECIKKKFEPIIM